MDSKKLSKKQKKALAFRERKGKGKAKDLDPTDNAVPIDENQDYLEAEAAGGDVARAEEVRAGASKGAQGSGKGAGSGQSAKKRKREGDGEEKKAESGDKPSKKKKQVKFVSEEAPSDEADETAAQSGRRYILFVGNLKYITTEESVRQHFTKTCGQTPKVRIRKPKPTSDGRESTKSKGFAFVEFSNWNALQAALKLHQSELDGRMINVELTAGGGGKSEKRLEKLKQRNKSLHEERKKSLAKRKKKQSAKDGDAAAEGNAELHAGADAQLDAAFARPQRYSATSGVEKVPLNKRTWSVADSVEATETSSKRKSRKAVKRRALGTGVNAIPVG